MHVTQRENEVPLLNTYNIKRFCSNTFIFGTMTDIVSCHQMGVLIMRVTQHENQAPLLDTYNIERFCSNTFIFETMTDIVSCHQMGV